MGVVEKTNGKLFKYMLMVVNPFKKAIIKTQCKVHKLSIFRHWRF